MRRVVAMGLLVLDCLIVVFWVAGFVLLYLGNLDGVIRSVHTAVVVTTMVAQVVWDFKCPLMTWKNKLEGKPFGHVLNPFLIGFGTTLGLRREIANKILSGVILTGGFYYLVELLYKTW